MAAARFDAFQRDRTGGTLFRVLSVLLIAVAVVLMNGHSAERAGHSPFAGPVVAGGELPIPTWILLPMLAVILLASSGRLGLRRRIQDFVPGRHSLRRGMPRLHRTGGGIAFGAFRHPDQGPKVRVERSSFHDTPLTMEARTLRSALRAPKRGDYPALEQISLEWSRRGFPREWK
jgi:hypothetical protein